MDRHTRGALLLLAAALGISAVLLAIGWRRRHPSRPTPTALGSVHVTFVRSPESVATAPRVAIHRAIEKDLSTEEGREVVSAPLYGDEVELKDLAPGLWILVAGSSLERNVVLRAGRNEVVWELPRRVPSPVQSP